MCKACEAPAAGNVWANWNGNIEVRQFWVSPLRGDVITVVPGDLGTMPDPGVPIEWGVYGQNLDNSWFWIADYPNAVSMSAVALANQLIAMHKLLIERAGFSLTPSGYVNEGDLAKARKTGRTVLGTSISPSPTSYHTFPIYAKG